MKRGNFRSGINQHGSNFGGGNNYYSGGGSFDYQPHNGGIMEDIIARSRALQDPTSESSPRLASPVASLGKIFQCPDKKTPAMPAKAPTPGGGHPQSTLQRSASRGRFTHIKKGKATNASGTAIGEF
jgi:hypothetical protein